MRFALAGAMAAAQVQRAERDPNVPIGTPGFYLDFELAVRPESADSPARATVFVPDTAADHFLKKLEQYWDENTRIRALRTLAESSRVPFQLANTRVGRRPRAFHCSEIPFVFNNTDVSAFATGGTTEAQELAAKVSDAWINFARNGDPNHRGLPK